MRANFSPFALVHHQPNTLLHPVSKLRRDLGRQGLRGAERGARSDDTEDRAAGKDLSPRREAGPAGAADRHPAGSSGSTTSASRTWTTRPSSSLSAPAATAARPSRARSPRPTSSPSRRPSANTAEAKGIDGPLFMGKDTHALSGPAQRTALEVLAANGVETVIQQDDGVTPTPVISRAILVHNRGRTARPGRRHRHHAVAQPARATAASSTTRPTAARPTPTSPTGSRTAPTSCCAADNAGVKRMPYETAAEATTTHAGRLRRCPTSTTCATSSTWTRSAAPA